jgi:hypothetical protein
MRCDACRPESEHVVGVSRPLISTIGGLPGEKNKSLIFADFRSIAVSKAVVEKGAGAGAVPAAD